MKKIQVLLLTAFLLLPIGIQAAYADGSAFTTGTATITPTCGMAIYPGTSIAFGPLVIDGTAIDPTALNFTNSGSVTGSVQVAGTNWVDGSSVSHIQAQHTAFQTTDQNGGTAWGTYGVFNKFLSSTNGFITFGDIIPGTNVNATYWGLSATIENTPFSGALTQTITFSETC